jgi:hypothetical protein
MGFSQYTTVSIGIKIQLEKLAHQINEQNFDDILKMFDIAYIDDKNNDFTHTLRLVLIDLDGEKDYEKFKNKFIKEIKKRGTTASSYHGKVVEVFSYGYLNEKYLLIPLKDLISTSRYGYGREGINGTYCGLNIDTQHIKNMLEEKYSWLKDGELVMMLQQSCG